METKDFFSALSPPTSDIKKTTTPKKKNFFPVVTAHQLYLKRAQSYRPPLPVANL
jgi:hypothetical protein